MRHWNELLNKAMLGSSKSPMLTSDIPYEILTAFDVSDIEDQEENFLRLSSLVFQFRQSGSLPLRIETMNQREAEPELSPYCSRDAMNVLNQILEEGHEEFLKLWLAHCEM